MNAENTNILFESYNENFNKFFENYYILIRERANLLALQNRVEPDEEGRLSLNMREMYYSHFFKDVVHWCKSFNLCTDDQLQTTDHYSRIDVLSFFESEEIKLHEERVEQIIFNCFLNYVDLAFKITAPLWSMIGIQDELIKSFIKSIEEKNDEALKKMKWESARSLAKYYSLINMKLSKIGDEELTRISKYIKYETIKVQKEFNQTIYEDEMGRIFDSAQRGNIRTQIENRFRPQKYKEWFDEL